ncbi:MAG: hypothetical protein IPM36_08355 [Lewinellaceae bacterium]|nr:hypothetical protein [Lewinellaceae bacterium]
MITISAQEALEILKSTQTLKDSTIKDTLELSALQNEGFDILTGISFYDCVFLENVVSWSVYHREN